MAKSAAQHLHDFHVQAAKFHASMAEAHLSMLKKTEGDAADNGAESQRAFHEAAAAAHANMQFWCNKSASEAKKAMEDDELNKREQLVPTNVSAVTDPVKAGVRPVLRAGQRELPGEGGMPQVDMKFAHLVKVDE